MFHAHRRAILSILLTTLLLLGCNDTGGSATSRSASPVRIKTEFISTEKPARPQVPHEIAAIARGDLSGMKHQASKILTAGLWGLCRRVTQEEIDQAKKSYGPHLDHLSDYYTNDAAEKALKEGKSFPIGAMVVKQKIGEDQDKKKAIVGVGGMIKREPGYDPKHGDWEYFYFEDPAKVEYGKLQNCIQCHRLAAKTDYVYGRWMPTEKEKGSKR